MSEIHEKPEVESRRTGSFRLLGFLNPAFAILFCLGLIVIGICINYVFGLSGTMLLHQDREIHEIELTKSNSGLKAEVVTADFSVTLDSVRVADHTPIYEFQLWKEDTVGGLTSYEGMPSARVCVSTFPLVPMEIHKVPESDFRFRLSEFLPNFSFSYSYPERIDTIEPNAPGVMLNLKTPEGDAIVTLRSDQPNKSRLADLVGLGARLEFYWDVPEEVLNPSLDSIAANRIVFAGKERKVYFLLAGSSNSRSLEKGIFYEIPGKKDLGFSLMHLFPDAAYLKAIPASTGSELLNPVAEVQIWKEGKGYQEVFLYPGKKAGMFEVPGTPYALILDVSQAHALQYCQATLSIKDAKEEMMTFEMTADSPVNFRGYRLKLAEYRAESPQQLGVEVSRKPGTFLLFGGGILTLVFLVLMLGKRHPDGKKANQI